MAPESSQWLTPKQIAERFQVQHKTVLEWIGAGKIRAKKFGRVWRVSPEALDEYLATLEDNRSKDPRHSGELTEGDNEQD